MLEYELIGDEGVLSVGEYPLEECPAEYDLCRVLGREPDAVAKAESPTGGMGTISSPENGVERGGVGLDGVT